MSPRDTHRLPADTRVGGVRLAVGDLHRSLTWYRQVLGFELLGTEESREARGHEGLTGPWAALGPTGGPVLVELFQCHEAQPVAPRTRLGLFHFAVLLPTRRDLGRFARHVTVLGEPMGAADHRVSEALYLQDPDGLGVEVYADRPRRDWRRRGSELDMTTEPLDMRALLAEAGDQEWVGLPPGTVMGHVHLHVGDLQGAEGFYDAKLGLDKTVWSYPGALFLAAGRYHHHLGLNTWAEGAPPASAGDARLLEWILELPGSSDVTAAAQAVGADAHGLVRDPWGTGLRLRVAR